MIRYFYTNTIPIFFHALDITRAMLYQHGKEAVFQKKKKKNGKQVKNKMLAVCSVINLVISNI